MEPATFDIELGKRILTKLTEQDVTLVQACEQTGIPYTTLHRHLNTGGLTTREVHALAALLNTTVSALAEAANA